MDPIQWTTVLPYVGPGVGGALAVLWGVKRFITGPLREENAVWREGMARENGAWRDLGTHHWAATTAAQHEIATILRDLVAQVSKLNGKMG